MQKSSTFGKRGRDRVITAPITKSAAHEYRQPSEVLKLVTFGIGFTIAIVAGSGLLVGMMMLTASPDLEPRTAADDATVVAHSQPAALSEADKVKRQMAGAWAICEGLNSVGAGTAPCEVGAASITIYSNSSVAHAEMLCSEAVRAVRASGESFEGRWTLYIKGPYSGSQSLAYCRLP